MTVTTTSARTPKPSALMFPPMRARLLHTFMHHELQAAELMCWALLKFSDAPQAFREGLLRICTDELRHMNGYGQLLVALGAAYGDFPVRDWFWERVPTCTTPLQFVALMSMGLEAANLEHSPMFEAQFRKVGDDAAADFLQVVARDEVEHVRFGVHWFAAFAGPVEFERWRAELPPPLSPLLMRGKAVDSLARQQAGMPSSFVEQLKRWRPDEPGS